MSRAKFGRIGILGGTFNPIHIGHLVLANEAKYLLGLEKVIFVPANLPPHKRARALASASQRHHMVTLAVKSNPSFKVSAYELARGGVSYSVETMKHFKSIFSHTSLYFIVGSDFLKEFSTWKDIHKLSRICKIVIFPRPNFPFKKPSIGSRGLPRNVRRIKVTALDISSRDIRKRIRTKRSIRYLVPEPVRAYILRKGLYRE